MTLEEAMIKYGPDAINEAALKLGSMREQAERVAEAYRVFGQRGVAVLSALQEMDAFTRAVNAAPGKR